MSSIAVEHASHALQIEAGLRVSVLVALAVFAPIYAYGGVQFAKYWHHILIQKRCPVLCLCLMSLFVLCAIFTSIGYWYDPFAIFTRGSNGIGAAAYGLVNIRLYLIYVRHQKHPNNATDQSLAWWCRIAMHRWGGVLCVALNVFGGVALLCIAGVPYVSPEATTPTIAAIWGVQMTITMCLLLVVWLKQVSAGIVCLRETLLSLTILFVISLLMPILRVYSMFAMKVVFMIAPYLQGIIPLFGGLYYVRRMSALNAKIRDDIEKPLNLFLCEHANYAMLWQYLTHCWASETLLFLHKVCILNHVVARHYNQESAPSGSIATTADAAAGQGADIDNLQFNVEQFAFPYLKQVYEHYERAIPSDDDDDTQQRSISSLYREIYDEFVAVGSVHEVNISWSVRSAAIAAFELDDEQSVQTVDGCLHIFHDAMEEVYVLVHSVYRVGFKEFISEHIASNDANELQSVQNTSISEISYHA